MKTEAPAVERVHPPRWVINHLVNPVARKVLRRGGRMSEEILLLRFNGRKTGTSYEIPVSFRRIDGRLALFTDSGWRLNFRGGLDVEIVLQGTPIPMTATLQDDPEEVAALFLRLIGELGREDAGRRLGIKIHVHRNPTADELADMARDSHLSIVWLDPVPAPVPEESRPSAPLEGAVRT